MEIFANLVQYGLLIVIVAYGVAEVIKKITTNATVTKLIPVYCALIGVGLAWGFPEILSAITTSNLRIVYGGVAGLLATGVYEGFGKFVSQFIASYTDNTNKG